MTEWINAADQKPDAEKPVLIFAKGQMQVAVWGPAAHAWRVVGGHSLSDEAVTHWHPLPQPPVLTKPHAKGVLLIEDDRAMRDVISIILQIGHIEIFTFYDGLGGVDFYQENHERVGLVILDFALPHMNGAEVAKALNAINPDVKIILVTALDVKDVTSALVEGTVTQIISKPFDIDAFEAAVSGYLEAAETDP